MRNRCTLYTVYTLDFAKYYKTYKNWKIVLFICWVLHTHLGDQIFFEEYNIHTFHSLIHVPVP